MASNFKPRRGHRHALPPLRRLACASERSAKPRCYGYSVLGGFKVNIDGGRIAGRERFFQRLVEQVIHMCYRGWKRFLRIFRGEHDFVAAFFAFVSSVYRVFAPATTRGVRLHLKRGPNRAFLTEIDNIKEASLGSEPLGGGLEAAATR